MDWARPSGWMDPRFKATLTEVRDLRIHISRSGDVAWYSAMLDDRAEWDGKPTGDRDIRWTGVLEKRRGKWVVVQMHGSVAKDEMINAATAYGRAAIEGCDPSWARRRSLDRSSSGLERRSL